MKLDGKLLADNILNSLIPKVESLKSRGITPMLTVIQVGDNPASLAYIRQKQKALEYIGANLSLLHFPHTATLTELNHAIDQSNTNPEVHGLIIQRPIPPEILQLNNLKHVTLAKDVDGFEPGTTFTVPVARAVMKFLEQVHDIQSPMDNLTKWLAHKKIVIIGRGETAGKPIADLLASIHCPATIITSQTQSPEKITINADVVISCAGKANIIHAKNCKKESILISVGIWRDEQGKLHGDYEPSEIETVASYYTPTPGGVGPVNVACLVENLIQAAQINTKKDL